MVKISEFAMSRSDAITVCIGNGKQFMQHFVKVMSDGVNGDNFKHHCHEMQNWFDIINNIKLKGNKKGLSLDQWMDWFFTAGGNIEDIIDYKYITYYEQLILTLMKDKNSKIEIIMKDILNNKENN